MKADIIGAFLILLVILVFVMAWKGWNDCSSRSGVYVRGIVWFECVAR